MSTLVVGLGHPDRGDDGIGAAVVAALPAAIDTVELQDPSGLLESFEGRDLVIAVDAARFGAPAGTVRRLDTGVGLPPLAMGRRVPPSSHALELETVVELARALGLLPARLVVLAVAAELFQPGAPLTPEAARAVSAVAAMVLEIVGCADQR